MGTTALTLFVLYAALAFGLRTAVHWRRTGSSGFKGISGAFGSLEWLAGVSFAVALALGFAAPLLDAISVLSPLGALDHPYLRVAGFGLFAAGLAGTLLAQFSMGDSWRIGVDATERTALVTAGPFAYVRNPIYTAMLLASAGLALLVPNVVAVVAFVAILAAIEIQVRTVEEPYLLREHGAAYRRYTAQVGRFIPRVGTMAGTA